MGTRSLTFVYDEDSRPINLYGQYDGYPSGHGADIAKFLSPLELVNGIPVGDERRIANGMGCLAAQLVATLKNGVGGFYINPVDTVECNQDYEYHIYTDNVVVKRYDGQVMFKGNWKEFESFCSEDA